jgi:hypothetical protein
MEGVIIPTGITVFFNFAQLLSNGAETANCAAIS